MPDESLAEGRSILALVDAGQWSEAVFTSYTLSLTFFESYVWPRLRQRGCETATIFVDVAGFSDSLMERRARGIGREYSVIPVHVKGGIFHPKLIHLTSRDSDDDLLLVGSGNLTYSGHGANVEVLEALQPSRHASAFNDAASFVSDLLTAERVGIPNTDALRRSGDRLLAIAARGQSLEEVRFVHSINESGRVPASSQARRLALKSTCTMLLMSTLVSAVALASALPATAVGISPSRSR